MHHSTTGLNGIKRIGLLAIATAFCMTASLAAAEHADDDDRYTPRVTRRGPHHVGPPATITGALRIDRRLDRRGARLNQEMDLMAAIAADFGHFQLAAVFDERGDRIQARYDRRGDRVVRRSIESAHRHHDGCGHAPAVRRGRHGPPPHAKAHGHRHGHRYGHRYGHRDVHRYEHPRDRGYGHRPGHVRATPPPHRDGHPHRYGPRPYRGH